LQLKLIELAGVAETFIGTCPDCGSQLEFAEGWKKRPACGTLSAGDAIIRGRPL
jgi:hypothetical protein